MDWLEKELAKALERKEPSPDFAAKLNARIEGEAPRRSRLLHFPRWIPAAAAFVILATSGSLAWRRHQGMVAKEQVMLAMRITAGKLNHVQAHMREAQQ